MSLSAICHHFDESNSVEASLKYLEAAEAHGKIFVEESRRQLQQFQQSEIDSIVACAILLCVLGFACYRIHRSNGIALADEAGWRWLHLLRGVRTAHRAAMESGQAIHPTIMQNMIPEISLSSHNIDPSTLANEVHSRHPLFAFVQRTSQERFEALHTAINKRRPASDKKHYDDLHAAIGTLYEVTEHICAGEVHSLFRAICTWPAKVSKDFMEMLTDCHPLALAVYAHWLMLVILIEDLWWIDDMGKAGIRQVVDICSKASSDIQGLMEWPRRSLDFEKWRSEFSCDVKHGM